MSIKTCLVLIKQEVANSAMMGAAYRAKFALLKKDFSYEDILKSLPEPTIVCEPYDDADTVSANRKSSCLKKITLTNLSMILLNFRYTSQWSNDIEASSSS